MNQELFPLGKLKNCVGICFCAAAAALLICASVVMIMLIDF